MEHNQQKSGVYLRVMGQSIRYDPSTRESQIENGEVLLPNHRLIDRDTGDVLMINLTTKCNLKCVYCYADDSTQKTLKLKDAIDGIEQYNTALISPLRAIHFFGGEPLLEIETLMSIVSYCKKKHPKTAMAVSTNGILLNEKILRYFKKEGILVYVSWDGDGGYRIDTNGVNSSKNVYLKIRDAAVILKHNLWVRITVTPDIDDIVKQIKEMNKINVRQFRIKDVALGEGHLTKSDLAKRKKMYERLAEYYLQQYKDNDPIKIEERGVGFTTILEDLNDKMPRHRGCECGISKVTLSADGVYIPCSRYIAQKHVLGDIKTGYCQNKSMKYRKASSPLGCVNCIAKSICGGPCHADLGHKPPLCDTCELTRHRTALAIWLRHKIKKLHIGSA